MSTQTLRDPVFLLFSRLLIASAVFFSAVLPLSAADEKNTGAADKTASATVITIENARSTSYEKDKETGDDCIVLEGSVKISVQKGNTKTTISAEHVRYDRKTEMMYATGSVSMQQTGSASGNDNATASSLLFNTATLEGVFDNGRVVQTQSDSLNLPSGSTLIVASDIFGRSESNTIAFKDGSLTFCDDPNPHWKIKSSRIWLLPGGEFAFLNALLFVGSVPIMYFPAFYYPKDELIFHPVFGYREREGYFVQTTSYVLGRKPLDAATTTTSTDDSDSTEKIKALFNFMKPSSLKKQKLEGLVLHNLDDNYSGDTSNYLKIMGDWYSNLGIMAGFDGVYKPKKYVTDIELSAKLGFSNTIFQDGSSYMPTAPSGKTYKDSSNLLGVELPFRYGANLKFTLSKPFSLTLAIPLYSDPYFSNDFIDRTETMDWISYLTETAAGTDDDDTVSEISSFSWTLNGSYSVPLASFIKPYISTLSATLNSSLVFTSLTNTKITGDTADTDGWKSYTPERKFYYPSQITPATANITWSGTLLTLPVPATPVKAATPPQFSVPLAVPDEIASAEDVKKEEAEKSTADTSEVPESGKTADSDNGTKSDGETNDSEQPLSPDALPSIAFSPIKGDSVAGLVYTLGYSVKPYYTSQIAYASTNLTQPEDFQWDNRKSDMYIVKVPITLSSSASYGGSFLSMTNNFDFSPVFQGHPYISTDTASGGYTEESAKSLRATDYAATKRDLTNSNSASFKPLCYLEHFKDTGVTYRNTIKIIRTNFIGDGDNPEWEYLTTDWDDNESITEHALDFTFAANEINSKFAQSLTLTTKLPPQVDEYYGTLNLKFPYTVFTLESGFAQTSVTDSTWIKKPLKQALSLSLFSDKLKFTESYNYNLEDNNSDSMKLALSWNSLQAAYTMSYTTGYDWDDTNGWTIRSGEEFLPYSFSLAWAPAQKKWYTWKNRISFSSSLSTSVVADLLRPTNSYFLFNPSISFAVNEFLTFTFSSSSKNSVLYRYFQSMLGDEGRVPGEENMFTDLFNSFRFDDESLRKSSGFKLKSLNFTLTHELHDWDFKTVFKLEPRYVTPSSGAPYYDFSPYVTISLLWRPMDSMKTEIVDDYGDWELNP